MPFFIAAAIAGVAGAGISALGANSAANTQAAAADQATQVQKQMYDQTVQREQPFVDAGGNSLAALMAGLGLGPNGGGIGTGSLNKPFSMQDFQKSPGYDFQMQQGEQAILDTQTARGGVGGGNTLKELTSFGQGVANQDYWNQYNAYVAQQNQQFGQLDTLAGSGQSAAANLGAIGNQTAGQIGNNLIGAGNSRSAGQIAGANAIGSGISSLSSNYLLSNLMGGGGFGGGGGGGGGNFGGGTDAYGFNGAGFMPFGGG